MFIRPLFLLLTASNILQGKLIINETPATIISGPTSQLKRPEGLAFSPSGDCLAVANSGNNSLTFYKSIAKKISKYGKAPSCLILHSHILNYVHDLSFSPCGNYLGTVSREKHVVAIFKRTQNDLLSFNIKPDWIMFGSKSKVQYPASIAFSSDSQSMIIANRMGGSGLTFYKAHENPEFHFVMKPFYQIPENTLLEFGLSAPHGISISPDGNLLAVIHKKFYKDPMAKGQTAFAIFEKSEDVPGGFKPTPVFVYPYDCTCLHSIAFHPSGKYLALTTNASVALFARNEKNYEYLPFYSIPLPCDPQTNEGPKGVAFSPDGKSLAVSTVENEVLIFNLQEE